MKNGYLLVLSLLFCGAALAQSNTNTPVTAKKLEVKQTQRSNEAAQPLKVISQTSETPSATSMPTQKIKAVAPAATATRSSVVIREEIRANTNNPEYDSSKAYRELKDAEYRERQQQD